MGHCKHNVVLKVRNKLFPEGLKFTSAGNRHKFLFWSHSSSLLLSCLLELTFFSPTICRVCFVKRARIIGDGL